MSLSRWNQFSIQLIKKYVHIRLAFNRKIQNQLGQVRVVIFENITGNFLLLIETLIFIMSGPFCVRRNSKSHGKEEKEKIIGKRKEYVSKR